MEKRKIQSIYSFQFKLRCRSSENARDINNALGPGTVIELMAQCWFKKFCSRVESFKDDEHSGRPSIIDNYRLRSLVNANARTTIRELASEVDVTTVTISSH